MLTIKYISPYGVEKLFTVREIEFDKCHAGPCQKGHTPSEGHVRFYFAQPGPEDRLEHVYSGIVYAMNEAGKTVAKYELGGLPDENMPTRSQTWTATTSASAPSQI